MGDWQTEIHTNFAMDVSRLEAGEAEQRQLLTSWSGRPLESDPSASGASSGSESYTLVAPPVGAAGPSTTPHPSTAPRRHGR